MRKNISKWTLLLGIILSVLLYLPTPIPDLLPNNIAGINTVDIFGFIMVYVIPALGIIGCIFSIYQKKWLYLLPNLILALSFFIYFFLLFTVGR